MSHEIRTPLNGILGFTDLLLKSGTSLESSEQIDYLKTIDRSGRHLLALINDILDLSKVEAGQMEVEVIECSPHDVLNETVSLLRSRALEKGVNLTYGWSTPVPERIQTDPSRLRQLLMNLVGNAIKFTDEGSVRIDAQLSDNRESLSINIADTGIGIPQEKIDSIFDPFVQADTSVTRRYGGTGLGLAICRRISEALGGELSVRSELGKGSVFCLDLTTGNPEQITVIDAPPADGASNKNSKKGPVSLSSLKVLLAEDGNINRKYFQAVLQEAGLDVVSVGKRLARSSIGK